MTATTRNKQTTTTKTSNDNSRRDWVLLYFIIIANYDYDDCPRYILLYFGPGRLLGPWVRQILNIDNITFV